MNSTTSHSDADQIINTMIAQLGGMGRLSVMINAKHFMKDDRDNQVTLQFSFSGCKHANRIRLTYHRGLDLYTLQILNITKRGLEVAEVFNGDGFYADMLIPTIERKTGLLLSI